MSTIAFDDLVAIVRRSVTSVPESRVLVGADSIGELGIDSITTLNIIMDAAETYGLDLERLEEFTTAPATLADLHELLGALSPVAKVA